MDIFEGHIMACFDNFFTRQFPANNPTKQTVFHYCPILPKSHPNWLTYVFTPANIYKLPLGSFSVSHWVTDAGSITRGCNELEMKNLTVFLSDTGVSEMTKTLFGRLAKLQGRISQFLKKSSATLRNSAKARKARDSRRFLLTMIAVWTAVGVTSTSARDYIPMPVIPARSVNAADSNVVPVEPIVTNVTVGQDLQIEQSKFSVEIRQSPNH